MSAKILATFAKPYVYPTHSVLLVLVPVPLLGQFGQLYLPAKLHGYVTSRRCVHDSMNIDDQSCLIV